MFDKNSPIEAERIEECRRRRRAFDEEIVEEDKGRSEARRAQSAERVIWMKAETAKEFKRVKDTMSSGMKQVLGKKYAFDKSGK